MQYRKLINLAIFALLLSPSLETMIILGMNSPRFEAQATEIDFKHLAQSSQQLSWGDVLQNILRQRPPTERRPGGGRGELCAIVPTASEAPAIIWNTRPLFVWQGRYNVIGVREKGATSDLWWGTVSTQSSSTMHLPYSGTALVPGKTYEWSFFVDPNRRSPLETVTFRVIDGKQRAVVTRDLSILESRLKAQNASEEAIALARTNYFAKKGLRSDALQEIYSVKQPSAELKQVMQDIEKQMCQLQE
ncbi:MAG: hypothetical protein NW220_09790 [Leptolyngbyaceae cyanobacterium bins.349]|nr:hypothetical protein [Leptolyngbyaceae cyanobacterium bins.349]